MVAATETMHSADSVRVPAQQMHGARACLAPPNSMDAEQRMLYTLVAVVSLGAVAHATAVWDFDADDKDEVLPGHNSTESGSTPAYWIAQSLAASSTTRQSSNSMPSF